MNQSADNTMTEDISPVKIAQSANSKDEEVEQFSEGEANDATFCNEVGFYV